jgi:FtsH-binding integral membrane protein
MSDASSTSFAAQARSCAIVFVAVLCGLGLMIGISFSHLANPVRIGLILTVALGNAGLVSCFLMHLLSERKFIYVVLIFTLIFFIALMGLTMLAHSDLPHLKPA